VSSELTSVVELVVSTPVESVSSSLVVVSSPEVEAVAVSVIADVAESVVVLDVAVAEVDEVALLVALLVDVDVVDVSPAVPSASPPPSLSSLVRDVQATSDRPANASTTGGNATTRCAAPQNGQCVGPSRRWR
jgi:hypothetical protein